MSLLCNATSAPTQRVCSSRVPRSSRGCVLTAAQKPAAGHAAVGRAAEQPVGSRFHAALLAGVVLCSSVAPAWAESPADCEGPDCGTAPVSLFPGATDAQRAKLGAMDDNFRNSSTLKSLLEKSAANKDKNKKEILDKYCYRQAELGVGDCGGLRYIPGMTKNGKQKTPKWLEDALGVQQPSMEGDGLTLSDLLGPNADK